MRDGTVMSEVYSIEDYNDWDHTIFKAAEKFREKRQIWPNILLGCSETLRAFDLFMSKKLMKEGKTRRVESIETFECSQFVLQVGLDEETPEHQFALVYDDEAEFIEEEPSVRPKDAGV